MARGDYRHADTPGARGIGSPRDRKIIVDFLNGKMPGYVDTGLNLVGVEECARPLRFRKKQSR